MDFIKENIGDNKVFKLPEQHGEFVQGIVRPNKKNSVFDDMICPLKIFQDLQTKGTDHTPKRPRQENYGHHSMIQRNDGDLMNNNMYLYNLYAQIDPLFPIKKDKMQILKDFKQELSASLNNEKQYFKKFGFSKKRSLTCEEMQKQILNHETDNKMHDLTLAYLCKICKVCLTIINKQTLNKTIINDLTPDNKILLVTEPNKEFTIVSLLEINDKLVMSLKEKYPNFQKIESMDFNELRHLSKFISLDNSVFKKKDEIIQNFKKYYL